MGHCAAAVEAASKAPDVAVRECSGLPAGGNLMGRTFAGNVPAMSAIVTESPVMTSRPVWVVHQGALAPDSALRRYRLLGEPVADLRRQHRVTGQCCADHGVQAHAR